MSGFRPGRLPLSTCRLEKLSLAGGAARAAGAERRPPSAFARSGATIQRPLLLGSCRAIGLDPTRHRWLPTDTAYLQQPESS